PFPSNSALELSRFALEGLRKIFKPGYHYKKAGVMVMDLSPQSQNQLKLFGDGDPRHMPLMEALDKVNSSFGQQKIRLASQAPGRIWRMRQDNLSPAYTTKLSDIITVKS
ncbi:MAG: DUF4113 domain-containing protein, partial [Bacteroidetes bacterium]|nr:DUF4113 domain-containing protein [Bacteroidota bacterium]